MAIKQILFNTEMVRAILDGRKTCTRRLVRFMPGENPQWTGYIRNGLMLYNGRNDPCIIKAPYQPGDILYVREIWEHFECCCCEGDEHGNCYREPQQSVLNKSCGCYMYRATDEIYGDARWHPSIHMPKEAARIWLKVTDVRVERLQEITEEKACVEGTDPWDEACYENNGWHPTFSDPDSGGDPNMIDGFHKLWNSTIKKSDLDRYGWDANPWVWVIEFERCKKPEEDKRCD